MKIFFTMLCLFIPVSSFALTADWVNNTEPDMKEYTVYMCKVKNCTVEQIASQKVATVPYTVGNQRPSWPIPNGIEGTLAVTASDTSGNESPLSNQVKFDSLTPGAPAGVTINLSVNLQVNK
jgi:hypothetical protein